MEREKGITAENVSCFKQMEDRKKKNINRRLVPAGVLKGGVLFIIPVPFQRKKIRNKGIKEISNFAPAFCSLTNTF